MNHPPFLRESTRTNSSNNPNKRKRLGVNFLGFNSVVSVIDDVYVDNEAPVVTLIYMRTFIGV